MLCSGCVDTIQDTFNEYACGLCGQRAYRGGLCGTCRRDTKLSGLVYLGHFEGALKEILHALKYEDVRNAAAVLGGALAEGVKDAGLPRGVIIPIPLSKPRRRERGYNQAALIAGALADAIDWPLLDALERVKHTKPQTKLSRSLRLANMTDAFQSRFNFKESNLPVYLVDDVATTGATLTAAARALKKTGAHRVVGIVVATGH